MIRQLISQYFGQSTHLLPQLIHRVTERSNSEMSDCWTSALCTVIHIFKHFSSFRSFLIPFYCQQCSKDNVLAFLYFFQIRNARVQHKEKVVDVLTNAKDNAHIYAYKSSVQSHLFYTNTNLDDSNSLPCQLFSSHSLNGMFQLGNPIFA